MKNQIKPLNILLGLGMITAIIPGYNSVAVAQYQQNNEANSYQSNERDSLYGDGITGINPLDLIHRANLSNGRSYEEFNQDAAGQIQNSASEFKRLQQEKIIEQYQQSETPADSTLE